MTKRVKEIVEANGVRVEFVGEGTVALTQFPEDWLDSTCEHFADALKKTGLRVLIPWEGNSPPEKEQEG